MVTILQIIFRLNSLIRVVRNISHAKRCCMLSVYFPVISFKKYMKNHKSSEQRNSEKNLFAKLSPFINSPVQYCMYNAHATKSNDIITFPN